MNAGGRAQDEEAGDRSSAVKGLTALPHSVHSHPGGLYGSVAKTLKVTKGKSRVLTPLPRGVFFQPPQFRQNHWEIRPKPPKKTLKIAQKTAAFDAKNAVFFQIRNRLPRRLVRHSPKGDGGSLGEGGSTNILPRPTSSTQK
jgi:hypothetical protein